FVNEPNKDNPLYEWNNRTLGANNLRASRTFLTWLQANGDPRLSYYFGAGPTYLGIDQGDFLNTNTALANASIAQLRPIDPVHFIAKAGSYILQAEALERYYAGAGAKAAYDAGVAAAFAQSGVGAQAAAFTGTGGAYAYPSSGTFEQKLEAII